MNIEKRLKRFWSKVEKGPECWLWRGDINQYGYGMMHVNRVRLSVHRLAYEFSGKIIPEGMVLDHLCRNRRCVNPSHLEPVTVRENLMRGDTLAAKNFAKTHCSKGHPFSPENTRVILANGRPERRCITCVKIRNAKYRETA